MSRACTADARDLGFARAWRRFKRACRRFLVVPPMVTLAPPELQRAMHVLHEMIEVEERSVELQEELLHLLEHMNVERLAAALPRATSLLAFFAAFNSAMGAATSEASARRTPTPRVPWVA